MTIPYDTRLPPDLRDLKVEIEEHARQFGLDFYETIFEVVDADDLNEIAAYGGFPNRYPHWSFGMAYEELKKGYEYGLSKIYEMVINNDPCYAYLMRCNHTVDQKLVMAHVYGHCLAPETKIYTQQRGNIPITEVKPGDKVLTHGHRLRRVAVCARRPYQGKIVCLTVAKKGEAPQRIRITPEHPVFALQAPIDGVGKMGWVNAGHLQLSDQLVCPYDHEKKLFDLFQRVKKSPKLVTAYGFPVHQFTSLVAIEVEEYDGYVYNFSVKEDESYTLAAGFVVHNCDFFKNNAYFAHTSRKMMDEMANHGARIHHYVEKHGETDVEAFLDRCMSVDDLIDMHSTAIKRREEHSRYDFKEPVEEEEHLTRFKSKDYMAEYINPREALKAEEEKFKKDQLAIERSFPERPERDVLLFLIENAPLKPWQRDILSIVRDEAYYFAPQGQTKVINEGWASFWHSTIMTERALEGWECIDYADHHSGTMAMSRGRLNPYKLGIELLRDIERRWNTGQFGKEWEECDDIAKKRSWNLNLGLGRAKIFEVRKIHNDITFIDTFLTPEFCREHKLFSFAHNEPQNNYVIESREFQQVKQRLLFSLTNHGRPFIYVQDGNYRNRGELLLRHEYNGIDLRMDRAGDTLANVQAMWGRPVHLQTVSENKPSLLSHDGTNFTQKNLGETDDPRKNAPPPTK